MATQITLVCNVFVLMQKVICLNDLGNSLDFGNLWPVKSPLKLWKWWLITHLKIWDASNWRLISFERNLQKRPLFVFAVDTFTVRTIGDDTYDHMWVYPSGEHYQFEVTGCEGALLLLAEEPLAPEGHALEIIIGNNLDTSLTILEINGSKNTTIYNEEMRFLMNCHSAHHFWVTWYEGVIEFGKGKLQEGENLLNRLVPVPFPVRAVSLGASVVTTPTGLPNILTWDYAMDQGINSRNRIAFWLYHVWRMQMSINIVSKLPFLLRATDHYQASMMAFVMTIFNVYFWQIFTGDKLMTKYNLSNNNKNKCCRYTDHLKCLSQVLSM